MRPTAAASLVALAVLTACSGDTGDTGDSTERTLRPPGDTTGAESLDWDGCGGGAECAELEVPLDRRDPGGATLRLAVARHPATGDRIGVLLVNPGGPGGEARSMAIDAEEIFPGEVVERFDIVAWDPRGTGESSPADCLEARDLDRFWALDRSPDTQAEVDDNLAESRAFADACARAQGEILPHLSTLATVDDMERLREALGEEQISYLGFSYGTLIGARYADAHPERVRAMVLDGAVDPALGPDELVLNQARGFDAALEAFLDDCAADDECLFAPGGDPHEAYDRLLAGIDAEPVYAVGQDGVERGLGPGEADLGVAAVLYSGRAAWPALAAALAEAARGDGSTLLTFSELYVRRNDDGTYTDDLEASFAIGCLDGPRPTPDGVARLAEEAARVAPRFGATTAWYGLPCAFWPAEPDFRTGPVRGAGAGPVLVIGSTGDPATPFAQAEALAGQLESARLLVRESEAHTAYLEGDACVEDVVHALLVDLEQPRDRVRC